MALTDKRRMFVETYFLVGWNATEAARRVGYKYPEVDGARLKNDPEIDAAIKARISEAAMSADEVLHRLAEQARNEFAGYIITNGEGTPSVDTQAMIEDGKAHLIKGIKYDKMGNVIIESFDAQAALVHIGRHHKLFTDKMSLDVEDAREKLKRLFGGDDSKPNA